ncbi:hypothetical protein [Sphingopyxis sp. PAMC25046]|uniref:hypothetical protein n=1 Tax=Sphingopyxis sp. PAMC25046 TaxID=2565556 RepID=UPI001448863C|nr:hypothetical protein [Sphingopyxis sp. PAMC25046]
MHPYHLILKNVDSSEARRVDFRASSPDHAFQIARNEQSGVFVELWNGASLLARMTKAAENMWQLLPVEGGRPANAVS